VGLLCGLVIGRGEDGEGGGVWIVDGMEGVEMAWGWEVGRGRRDDGVKRG